MQNNKATPSVANTAATLLYGAAGTNSISANFIAGDTITVNGTDLTFMASGAAGTTSSTSPTTSEPCWARSTRSRERHREPVHDRRRLDHAAFRHAANLSVTSSNSTAFAALGFTGTVTATRGGGGSVGTGQVIGNDNSTFLDESVAGGAVTTYDVSGAPVNLQFRWAKTDSASLGAGHTDTWNLFYQVNPNATGTQVAWQNVNTNFTFSA